MKTGAILSIISGLSAVSAAALEKRQTPNIDGTILNYALTLEHLEDVFYKEGLAKFSQADFAAAGFGGAFYANLKEISRDEDVHVSFLR